MDQQWVDAWVDALEERFAAERAQFTMFEPADSLYENLAGGDERLLQASADQIARHLRLTRPPKVVYEFALLLDREAAGDIRYDRAVGGVIRVPADYAGMPMAIGGILAHEFAHAFLFSEGVAPPNAEDVEPLTDLAAIETGLGKLMLNGIVADSGSQAGVTTTLGYLPAELKVYACRRFCAGHGVTDAAWRRGLCERAIELLDAHRA